jgi:hypothetical protein
MFIVTASLLYMFRTLSASIIRSTETVLAATGACHGHPHRIYIIPTHDSHQWLLLQFLVLLMKDAESVRSMSSYLAVTINILPKLHLVGPYII